MKFLNLLRLIGEAKSLEIFGTQKELVVLLILNNLCSHVADVRNVASELFTIIKAFLISSKQTLTAALSQPLCVSIPLLILICPIIYSYFKCFFNLEGVNNKYG